MMDGSRSKLKLASVTRLERASRDSKREKESTSVKKSTVGQARSSRSVVVEIAIAALRVSYSSDRDRDPVLYEDRLFTVNLTRLECGTPLHR